MNAQLVLNVTDAKTNQPIEGAHVFGPHLLGISNSNGRVSIRSNHSATDIFITHIGYDTLYFKMDKERLTQGAVLHPRTEELNEFTIYREKLETVFHSNYHYVFDYEFVDDQLLLITFNKKLKDAELTLCTMDQKVLSETKFEGEPVGLKKDFRNRIFLETEYKTYQIHKKGNLINLVAVNAADYKFSMEHCVDSLRQHVLFNDFIEYLPRMNYYALNSKDSNHFLLASLTNDVVNKMYRWEYYELPLEKKREARELAEKIPSMDKKDVAAIFTGFHKSIYYEPVYAPLFVYQDSIFIFDHSENKLTKYVDFQKVDSVDLSYHYSERRFLWKRQLLFDNQQNKFYAVFKKNGYFLIKNVDLKNGGVAQSYKVQKQFAENLQVKNGYAYYIYKKPSSPEKPYLYREFLGR